MTHHPSFGTLVKVDPNGGTGYTLIGQVMDITGPNITRGDIDVTDQDDAATYYRIFLPGIADPGDLTFTIGFDPESTIHQQSAGTGILGDFERDGCTLADWQVTLKTCNQTAIWTFEGYLNSWSGSYPLEGQLTADIGIKISGKPTLSVT